MVFISRKKVFYTKKKLYAIVFGLKKNRVHLYVQRFILEVDAQCLIGMLNKPDLSDAAMTCWLAWVKLFDFEVRHIPEKDNVIADALSRKARDKDEDTQEDEAEQVEIDEVIDATINAIKIGEKGEFAAESYDGEFKAIGEYLVSLARNKTMSIEEFKVLKRKASKFIVFKGHLFKKGKRNAVPRRVVCSTDEQMKIIQECHEGLGAGHRGRDGTQLKVNLCYYWDGMSDHIRTYVDTCEICQKQSTYREVEPLNPTWTSIIFNKVGVDIVHMPKGIGQRTILL